MKRELQTLPGVGPSIEMDLRRLGVKSVRDLARRDPERLYARLCAITGERQDPCVLYTFRCAVYAARTQRPKAELLKWWSWKGRILTFILLASLVAVGTASADAMFRCGSKIVVTGMTQSEILRYCGEPTSKTEEVVPVRSGNQVVGETRHHRWTYTSYGATRVLVFDQDTLKSIE